MSTAIPDYRNWGFLYANALLEPDGNRLPERITAAETAVNYRLQALANNSADNHEKADLIDALNALQALRTRLSGLL
jgi:hypothetical protein